MHRLVPIDHNAQLLIGIPQPVADVRRALHALDDRRHLPCNAAEGVQIPAPHLNGDAAASHSAHIHAGGVDADLSIKAGSLFPDHLGDLFVAHRFIFLRHHIDGGGIGTAAAHAAQHGHGGAAGHGPHILHILYGEHCLHHLIGQFPCLVQRGILRKGHIHGELGGIHVRHESGSVGERQRHASGQQKQHQNEHQSLHPQRPAQQLFIGPRQAPKDPAVLLLLSIGQKLRGHGRHHSQSDGQTGQKGVCDGKSHVHEQLSRDALREHNGQENAYRGQSGGQYGSRHLSGPLHGRLPCRISLAAQAIDILNDHNGIIYQHAYAQCKTRQRNDVQGDAAEIHADNCSHQTYGNGKRNHQRRTEIFQKQQQYGNGQHAAEKDIVDDGVHHQIYIDPLIHKCDQ